MIQHQIPIGTCIPGQDFMAWVPKLKDKGFECFSVNFHMTLGNIKLEELAPRVTDELADTNIKVSALGYYCNPLENEEQRSTLHHAIDMASAFHTSTVSTFAGALSGQSVDAAMPKFKEVFGELVRHAEDKGVRLAIENCPMGSTWKHGGCNIGFNPRAWDMMFEEVPSDSLGLEWEPAHQMCQLIDPIANLRKYAKKIIHIHAKDARIKRDVLADEGIWGRENFVEFRFPGFGDTDWREVIEILQSVGYSGMMSIEGYHDYLFNNQWEYTGQMHALQYLKWCRGGEFAPNPWDA